MEARYPFWLRGTFVLALPSVLVYLPCSIWGAAAKRTQHFRPKMEIVLPDGDLPHI